MYAVSNPVSCGTVFWDYFLCFCDETLLCPIVFFKGLYVIYSMTLNAFFSCSFLFNAASKKNKDPFQRFRVLCGIPMQPDRDISVSGLNRFLTVRKPVNYGFEPIVVEKRHFVFFLVIIGLFYQHFCFRWLP